MKITLKNTPEQVELVKAMASRNRDVAYEAQTALAEFIGPVLAEVINNAPALSDEDYVQVYSQSRAGGLPTSEVLPTSSELKLATYSLDSAVSFDRRYAAKSRMDVVAKTMTRVAQEILLKQNTISANVVLKALADAETNDLSHVFESSANSRFTLADLNAMMTRSKRIVTSFVGGTPDARQGRGVTDIICSPEVVEELRAIAYNPINTKAAPGASANSNVRTADVIAEQAFQAAGAPEFYGINVIELNEMGGFGASATAQAFDTVFKQHAGTTVYAKADGGAGSDFTAATDSLVLGIDRSRESLVRPVAVDSENGGEFNLIADDQYSIRQNKIGYFGSLEEGRIVIDDRALVGCLIATD